MDDVELEQKVGHMGLGQGKEEAAETPTTTDGSDDSVQGKGRCGRLDTTQHLFLYSDTPSTTTLHSTFFSKPLHQAKALFSETSMQTQ
ncbi:hypothetical protein HN873_070428 [Arachis hypogaea]